MKELKGWIVIIAILLFLGIALLVALLTKQRKPKPEPILSRSGVIYTEVMR